jgi:hypothetical protein
MECLLRTTLSIDSRVLAEFKRQAAETHRTISSLIEDALREHLSRERDRAATKPLDVPIVGGGGVAPGVDLTSSAALSDYVDRADGVYDRFRGHSAGARDAGPGTPDDASGAHAAGPDAPEVD